MADTVGFIFPTYFARVPVIIEKFIDRITECKSSYVFAIANGGGWFSRTMKIFEKHLSRKDIKLNGGGFVIGMPGNHPKIAEFNRTPHKEYFAQQEIRTKEIAGIFLVRKL